tara:strand:+ start:901 stop:5454 length:4554 start_codon:yes stop_codon:yes gene_type:complete
MNKLNREDFILQLRDKLPQYKDLDDDSLVDIVIKQYPVYESQVDLKKKDLTSDFTYGDDSLERTEDGKIKVNPFKAIGSTIIDDVNTVFFQPFYRGFLRSEQATETTDVLIPTADIDFDTISENEKKLRELDKHKSRFLKDFEKSGMSFDNAGNLIAASPELVGEVFGQMIGTILSDKGMAATGTGALGGSVVPGLGTVAGGAYSALAASSFMSEFGGTVLETIREEKKQDGSPKYDLMDSNNLMMAFQDKELMNRAKDKALKRGLPVALVDLATLKIGGVVSKTFKKSVAAGKMSMGGQAARLSAIESAGGGVGEATAQVVSTGGIESYEDIALESYLEIFAGSPSVLYNMNEAQSLNSVKEQKLNKEIKEIKKQINQETDPQIKETLSNINAKKRKELNKLNNELVENFSPNNRKERLKIKQLNSEVTQKEDVLKNTKDEKSKDIINKDINDLKKEIDTRVDALKNHNKNVKYYKIGDKVKNNEPLSDSEQKIYDNNQAEIESIYEQTVENNAKKEKDRIEKIKKKELSGETQSLIKGIYDRYVSPILEKPKNLFNDPFRKLTSLEESRDSKGAYEMFIATENFKIWENFDKQISQIFSPENYRELVDRYNSFLKQEEHNNVVESKTSLANWIDNTLKESGFDNLDKVDGKKYVRSLMNFSNHISNLQSFILENENIVKSYTDIADSKRKKDPEYQSLIDKVKESQGKYLTNTYEFLNDKNYDFNKNVEETRRKAEIKFEKELIDNLKKKNPKLNTKRLNDLANANEIKKQAQQKAGQLVKSLLEYVNSLDKESTNKILNETRLDDLEVNFSDLFTKKTNKLKEDFGIFKQRKNLDDILKTFLGQYKQAGTQYMNTVEKLSNLKNQQIFYESILKDYEGDLIFDINPDPNKYIKLDDPNINPANPLKDKFIDNDLYSAINQVEKYNSGAAKIAFDILSIMRQAKTVFNIPNIRKNILGNFFAMIQNGYFFTENGFFGNTSSMMQNLIQKNVMPNGKLSDDFKKSYKKASDYGLIGQSVGKALLLEDSAEIMNSVLNKEKKSKGLYNFIKFNFNKLIGRNAKDLYGNVDDYAKVTVFEAENKVTAIEEFGIEYEKLNDKQKKKVEELSAEKIKNTFPTWSRVPNFMRRDTKGAEKIITRPFGKQGIFGDFISFRYEAIRTFINSISEVQKSLDNFRDMRNKIPNETDPQKKEILERRKDAYLKTFGRRLIGTSTNFGVHALISGAYLKVALDLISSEENDLSDEEFMEKFKDSKNATNSLRKFFPTWMDGHSLLYDPKELKFVENSKSRYGGRYEMPVYDYSLENPYALVIDPIVNVLSDDTEEVSAKEVIGELRDFARPNMLVNLVTDVVKGTDYYGRKLPTIGSKLEYIARQSILPPNLNKAFRDIFEDEEFDASKLEDISELLFEFTFVRDYPFSPDQQFSFMLSDFQENKTQSELKRLRDIMSSGRLYSNVYENDLYQQLKKILRDSRLTKEEKDFILFEDTSLDNFNYKEKSSKAYEYFEKIFLDDEKNQD